MAVTYILNRAAHGPLGTFGVLSSMGVPICVTCEDPWLNNQHNISCIPAGIYNCSKYTGTKYRDVWLVENVPNRAGILIHWGNTQKDTQGCILVGKYFGQVNGLPAVMESAATFQDLKNRLPDGFTLQIIDASNAQ